MTLSTYFLRGETLAVTHRSVPKTKAVARAAITELMKGPNGFERSLGFSTSVPDGVQLLGVSVADSIATVDLSGAFESGGGAFSMGARLAQLTFTLTQFVTVRAVRLQLEGRTVESLGGEGVLIPRPMIRDDFDNFLPAILVESPAPGDPVSSPLTVRGIANTFEGEVIVRLIASDGAVLATGRGMAMMGDWAPFKVTLGFSGVQGAVSLQSFYYSPKDGAVVHLIEMPLMVG